MKARIMVKAFWEALGDSGSRFLAAMVGSFLAGFCYTGYVYFQLSSSPSLLGFPFTDCLLLSVVFMAPGMALTYFLPKLFEKRVIFAHLLCGFSTLFISPYFQGIATRHNPLPLLEMEAPFLIAIAFALIGVGFEKFALRFADSWKRLHQTAS